MLRRIVASLLVLALAASQLPARATGASAIGVVTQASRANLSDATASAGSTVFDGDSFTTASGGLVRVRTAAAQFYLASQSALCVHSVAAGTLAQLSAGTMVFSSARASAMDIEAAQAHIRPANDQPTVAQISIVSPKVIDIRAQRGALQFSYAGETQIVAEGASYRFVLDPSDDDLPISSFPHQKVPGPGRRRRKAFLYFIIGAMGVATYIAVDEALESPSKP